MDQKTTKYFKILQWKRFPSIQKKLYFGNKNRYKQKRQIINKYSSKPF